MAISSLLSDCYTNTTIAKNIFHFINILYRLQLIKINHTFAVQILSRDFILMKRIKKNLYVHTKTMLSGKDYQKVPCLVGW